MVSHWDLCLCYCWW